MKKNFFIPVILFSIFTSIIGCRKDSLKEQTGSIDMNTSAISNPRNECQLVQLSGAGFLYQYQYNEAGLNSSWDINDYGTFKQEYNASGQLQKSRWYIGDELITTIHFFYNNRGLAVHEIWYTGDTQEVYDEVFYTRNQQGLITRMESFFADYFSTAIFSPDGNIKEWHFYSGGAPVYSGYLEYRAPHRNFYLAVPGIEYIFPFINPFFGHSRNLPISEKLIIYDENGSPVVVIDNDPDKTVVQQGFRNFPISSTLYDRVDGVWDYFTFDYQNCGGNTSSSKPLIGKQKPVSKRAIQTSQLFKRSPQIPLKEHLKQQIKQLREKIQGK